ncbi:MAG: amidohydrolase family protein, partial [bacterium]|nr:amidohydrolase family protein [bacterium]
MILKAKHVIPVAGAGGLSRRAVIDNGLVEIHETRIVDVRPSKPHERGSSIIDCGDAVLLPGFVNAHTHLELSHLQGKVTPVVPVAAEVGDSVFTGWLRRLLAEMRSAPDEESGLAAAANEGAAFSLRAGVTTVGDITRRPDITRPVLRAGRLRVVSFGEVIALGALREKLRPRLDAALDRTHDSDRLNAAVSPHAPYTCDRRALRACKEAASAEKARLCMHLAESPEETLCTEHGRGPLVDLLRSVGVWNDSVKTPGLAPVEYADLLGLLSPRTLLAHVNYLSDADLDRLARSGVHVAYCPRTHAAFGHAPHRFGEMLSAGINVCIGTDSLASTP